MDAYNLGNDIVIYKLGELPFRWSSYVGCSANIAHYRAGTAVIEDGILILTVTIEKNIGKDDPYYRFKHLQQMCDKWPDTDSYIYRGTLYSVDGKSQSQPMYN